MKINKKELLKALEIVKPGLSNTELIEQSTSFAFLGDRVVTYNDLISISHPVDQLDLKGAIRADELYEFLKRIDEKEIQFALSENEIKMKSGKTKAGIRLAQEIKLPIEETGQVQESDWHDLPEDFHHDLNFIKDSASKDMSRRILTCVHIREHVLEASDSFQIMKVYIEGGDPFPFPDILVPSENISEIVKIEPHQIAKTSGWLHFRNRNETVLSCRTLVDKYVEIGELMEVEGANITFPKSMDEILDRVMVFTKSDQMMEEEMQVLLKSNKLMVKGKNEYGWIEEKAPVKYEGDAASFWITPHLLQGILKRSNECTLGSEKIKFEGEGWEYVAMLRNV